MDRSAKGLVALVWNHAPTKYNRTMLVLLLKLAGLTCADGYAYPSIGYLAASCGVSERAIQFCLQQLRRDGFLRIIGRKGRSSHFFLQVDALKKLPLAIKIEEEAETQETPQTPEPPAQPTQEVIDAEWLACAMHYSILKQIPDAHIPNDWRSAWTGAFQSLMDAGHTVEVIRDTARFALAHEGWSATLLGPRGALGFAETFDAIHRQYMATSQPAKAAA